MPWTKVLIEGREPFEIPNEYRDSDEMIIAALAPIYPQVSNADFRRETLVGDDVLVHVTPANKSDSDKRNMAISIAPHGRTKGAGDPAERFAGVLNRAKRYNNPLVALARKLEKVNAVDEQVMFDHIDEINIVMTDASAAFKYASEMTQRLDDAVEHQPAKYVPIGF